ncbi:ABC transporter ATP-binding protein [Cupriavidus sp. 2SB]|uniref:ABC transporter ATP-binding protein n=1 Tax=Cupriavidus sp. 2SB TaxID=2502199 RepID=UPI002017CECC|nr:ABC transporter ATP-binding protein [Cupriavidus sp. 2SB]
MKDVEPVLSIQDVAFRWPGQSVPSVAMPALELRAGERVFVSGPSGSGKSTLLNLIAGVLVPQQGEIVVQHTALRKLSAAQRDRHRAEHMGIIFQQLNLLPYLSVKDNVLLGCRFSRQRRERALAQGPTIGDAAEMLLGRLNLDASLWQRPAAQLSVGQQQRVAAARALLGRPRLVLADEPTSALDADRQSAFMSLLMRECEAAGASLVFVSHDMRLASRFDMQFTMPATGEERP